MTSVRGVIVKRDKKRSSRDSQEILEILEVVEVLYLRGVIVKREGSKPYLTSRGVYTLHPKPYTLHPPFQNVTPSTPHPEP